ncbi:hypothetical protein GCK32_015994, partial [Trichostrongylus colubriformis]
RSQISVEERASFLYLSDGKPLLRQLWATATLVGS